MMFIEILRRRRLPLGDSGREEDQYTITNRLLACDNLSIVSPIKSVINQFLSFCLTW